MEEYNNYIKLDDKYELKYFCQKYNILYPDTISVGSSICEVRRFIIKFKTKYF